MIFKHDLDISLKLLLRILDAWTQLMFGEEITITSDYRPPGEKPSFHPKWQAVDLRTKNMPDMAIIGWQMLIKQINENNKTIKGFEGEFTWLHEDIGNNNEHFHLQLRRGEPI